MRLSDRIRPGILGSVLRQVQGTLPGSVRVAVLRIDGSGPEQPGLSAETEGGAALPTDAELAVSQRGFDWTSDPAYVSVAAVQGHALGPGLQLALGCDLRLVATDTVLELPEVPHGSVPHLGSTGALVTAVGFARALELSVTGRRVSGSEAYAIGLAQRLVEPDRLDDEVERLVAALLAPDRDAVRELKALLLGAPGRSTSRQRVAELQAQRRLHEDRLDAQATAKPEANSERRR